MGKRFYLATRKDHSAEAEPLVEALRVNGWERTFAWSGEDSKGAEGYAKTAVEELEGVRAADVLIVLFPAGRGTHVEIGVALALGKPVIIHTPDRKTLDSPYPCVFHYHPGVKLLISEPLNVDEVLACLPSNFHHGPS